MGGVEAVICRVWFRCVCAQEKVDVLLVPGDKVRCQVKVMNGSKQRSALSLQGGL